MEDDQYYQLDKDNSFWLGIYTDQVKNFSDPSHQISGIKYFLMLRNQIKGKADIGFQIFDSSFIISINHIQKVLKTVLNAFQDQRNISNKPEIEFLLYLTMERQIQDAIKKAGVTFSNKNDEIQFGIIFFGKNSIVQTYVVDFLQKTSFNLSPFIETHHNNKDLISKFKINRNLIKRQYWLYNINKDENKEKNSKKISINEIPSQIFHKILSNLISQKITEFYLNNY